MEQLVQCPVCTLFLHNGMSLESHLDTHPKDQVIRALCSLTTKGSSNFGSRTSTPLNSERSFRSRSRTPAADDGGRWTASHRSGSEHDRYWRRTPSRTPKSASVSTSRINTPDIRSNSMVDNIAYETSSGSPSVQSHTPFSMKTDKSQQTFQTPIDFEQQCMYYSEQQEDREIKYSRSAEYNALDNANNMFTYSIPTSMPGVKVPTPLMTGPVSRRGNELVKILPKPNNLLMKNVGGVQYVSQAGKPTHLVMPAPPFLQKNIQSNMIVASNIPATPVQIESKSHPQPPPLTNQFGQLASGSFSPGTTVVTQNSQIIYREMVSLDGKPFISSMPVLTGHENVTNVSQGSSVYQNVMVVDQFGNTSCMYTPPAVLPKTCPPTLYSEMPHTSVDVEKVQSASDPNKTLIIEVGPILPSEEHDVASSTSAMPSPFTEPGTLKHRKEGRKGTKTESQSTTKGLKILSNIKVEVPVQHNKNMINTIMDLTVGNDTEFPEATVSPVSIIADSQDKPEATVGISQFSLSNSFASIKNSTARKSPMDNKVESDFGDSCPVPDLICNEKPSISPCSELSENGDNTVEGNGRTGECNITLNATSPKAEHSKSQNKHSEIRDKTQLPPKPRNTLLRLNNIYVKKNKKVLQIKYRKTNPDPLAACPTVKVEEELKPSSSKPINFSPSSSSKSSSLEQCKDGPKVSIVSIEEEPNDETEKFIPDTEEQSMDIDSVAPDSMSSSKEFDSSTEVMVKEEVNTSNEGAFSNEGTSTQLTSLENTLRPINIVSYGSMSSDFDEESNHRELLELEAASKTKQFVSMMNDSYFNDNMYTDYFTSERVDAFDEREAPRDGNKEMYTCNIWGEPSQKEAEFVLPNFIHESYKIAESAIEYEGGEERADGEAEACERDSKADVLSERSEGETPLNICADERMPPRGELSGQESNGDMESPWAGMYSEVTPSEPYDLMARESWVSDGSEVDTTEKQETLEEEVFPKARVHTCASCGAKFPALRELRAHRARAHAPDTYSRMISARAIKKEEKNDDGTAPFAPIEPKDISSSLIPGFEPIEAKPKLEALIKQEPKRKRRDYVCSTCKVDQLTDAQFRVHLKIHPLECLTCGKCFFRRSNLALHLKMHMGIKNFKCEVCEKRFVTKQKLLEHENIHTGRSPIKCTLCDDTFRRYSNMLQHRNRHHYQKRAKQRDYVCQCGGVFSSAARLAWHRETHDDRPKACHYCPDKFVHAASLTRHVRRAHNQYFVAPRGDAENVPCPVCKQIYLRSNLRTHMATHSGKRPFACVICNKAFTTKWNLKLHRWTHMSRSAKPYKCTLCKGAFIRQSEFLAHMNAHKSVRPYTCNYCGCQFVRKYNCQRHVREHEVAKKFVCKVPDCGKSFHRSYYLSEHMKVHSGARPFSCNICGKTSSNKSNHNKHVKIHHAREPVATEA